MYRQAAEQGNAYAKLHLGLCYGNGAGVAKDPVQAVYWYMQAADQNVPEAMFLLGLCCEVGLGSEKDLDAAVLWYCKAAKCGYEDLDAVRTALERISDLQKKRRKNGLKNKSMNQP